MQCSSGDRHHRFTLDKKTMYQDGHRVLTMTSQCDGVTLQEQDQLRAQIVRLLNEAEVGPISDDPNFNALPASGWTCFHCGEHFLATWVGQRDARYHFGPQPTDEPGCVMKLNRQERGPLAVLRNQEEELERNRAEDSEKDREMAAMRRSDHAQALIREEEKGYNKGVRDARAEDHADAERWRALMSSQRIRIMGSAGFAKVDGQWKPAREDLHMGVEFWSIHPAAHPSTEYPQDLCRAQLIAYVDELIRRRE
jgi:hypothetical protein